VGLVFTWKVEVLVTINLVLFMVLNTLAVKNLHNDNCTQIHVPVTQSVHKSQAKNKKTKQLKLVVHKII